MNPSVSLKLTSIPATFHDTSESDNYDLVITRWTEEKRLRLQVDRQLRNTNSLWDSLMSTFMAEVEKSIPRIETLWENIPDGFRIDIRETFVNGEIHLWPLLRSLE